MPAIPFQLRPLEFDLYISPDDQTYRFNNATDQFVIAGVSGTGMPPITYRTQRGPFQHGVTPLGFILEPRLIQLLHRRNATSRENYWTARQDILNLLRPNRQSGSDLELGVLRKIHEPDRVTRDISVFIQSGPEFVGTIQGRWDEFGFTEAIQFIAHDPTFFDPIKVQVDLTLDSNAEDIEFAFDFPFTFLSSALGETDTITYVGTWDTFPTILLIGPMRNPIVRNLTTGEKIELNTTIAIGRTVTVSLQYGNKTVIDDLGTNLIGTLTPDSDLATFHLAPAPEAPLGVNSIGVAAFELAATSRIVLEYFTRYIGI